MSLSEESWAGILGLEGSDFYMGIPCMCSTGPLMLWENMLPVVPLVDVAGQQATCFFPKEGVICARTHLGTTNLLNLVMSVSSLEV